MASAAPGASIDVVRLGQMVDKIQHHAVAIQEDCPSAMGPVHPRDSAGAIGVIDFGQPVRRAHVLDEFGGVIRR